MLESISVNDLKCISNAHIIDIRSNQKYNDKHIINSINIPFEQLLIYPFNYLNKNDIYYIYCQKGNKSKQLCLSLKRQGYKVINILGGYEAWILNN